MHTTIHQVSLTAFSPNAEIADLNAKQLRRLVQNQYDAVYRAEQSTRPVASTMRHARALAALLFLCMHDTLSTVFVATFPVRYTVKEPLANPPANDYVIHNVSRCTHSTSIVLQFASVRADTHMRF